MQSRRSIFSRITGLAIGLSILLLFGLWLLTDQTIQRTMDAAIASQVDIDLAGLVDIYASGGSSELERRIGDRLELIPTEGNPTHYLLTDGQGERLAGNITRWPDINASVSESGKIRIGEGKFGYGRAVQLAPDLRLLVAHENSQKVPLLRRVAFVFAGGGLAFILILGFFAQMASLRLQRRIGQINMAFRSPDSDRLVINDLGNADEIDELANHSAKAIARVENLMEAYRDTSDQVAHEIRTPLMHLDQRLVKALASRPGAAVAERLVEARAEIRRIVNTLESLLDITASKARQGDRLGLLPLNLSELVSRICELYEDSADESGHSFDWTVDPNIEFVGEENQLSRLVTNLLDNAFKYVPVGGKVELSLEAGPVLMVRDDGPGIPQDEREKVFKRFYRGSAEAGDQAGSGLGLALARAIAERHGLKIQVEDTKQGATLRVDGEGL